VIDWLIANEADFVPDSIILGELYVGVLSLPSGRKRRQLQQWFEALAQTIKCLPYISEQCRAGWRKANQGVPPVRFAAGPYG
jgi:hypothetical protein